MGLATKSKQLSDTPEIMQTDDDKDEDDEDGGLYAQKGKRTSSLTDITTEDQVDSEKKKGRRFFFREEVDEHRNVQSHYPEFIEPFMDMSRPLCDYFISSGHNSYLTGNQLSSKSSVKIVVKALKQGCRVIELDVWDSSKGPRVLHGGTLTSGVMFSDCVKGIANHAFESTPFPVILTIENHCNIENQVKIARILKTHLGDMLYEPPPDKDWDDSSELDSIATLPSPADLKHKIIYRDKHIKDFPKKTLSPELSKLIGIRNVKFHTSVESVKSVSSSQNESKIRELLEKHDQSARHTRKHLVRIYPSGRRVDSSNFDPGAAWCSGAQVVALNWQTKTEPLWVYHGLFRDNARAGYVLKPPFLLEDDKYKDPSTAPVTETLKVSVLSIRHMTKRKGWHPSFIREDAYVRAEVYGAPRDQSKQRTRVIQAADRCTFDQTFFFPVCCREVGVLLLVVMDRDFGRVDDFLGQVALPLRALEEGKFVLPLLDKYGTEVSSGYERKFSVVVGLEWIEGEVRDDVAAGQAQVATLKRKLNEQRLANLDALKLSEQVEGMGIEDLQLELAKARAAMNQAIKEKQELATQCESLKIQLSSKAAPEAGPGIGGKASPRKLITPRSMRGTTLGKIRSGRGRKNTAPAAK